MSGGHLHDNHDQSDAFYHKIAITMTLLTATLSGLALLSHRAHTETVRLSAQASIMAAKASDMWSFYQEKKDRYHEYEVSLVLFAAMNKDREGAKSVAPTIAIWEERIAKYQVELPMHQQDAREFEKRGAEFQAESEEVHHRANFYDSAELVVELGIVFASLALISRREKFWQASVMFGFGGIIVAIIGALLKLF